MAYFGPGGIKGSVHPSLRTYIECFLSPPFPKMFPRGGGIWDQDPMLMHDFRLIRRFELEWKESQEQIREAQANHFGGGAPSGSRGGGDHLGGALDQYLETLQEEGHY